MRTTGLRFCGTSKFQTDKQPDLVVIDKEQKTAFVTDVANPVDSNIRTKEQEKVEK